MSPTCNGRFACTIARDLSVWSMLYHHPIWIPVLERLKINKNNLKNFLNKNPAAELLTAYGPGIWTQFVRYFARIFWRLSHIRWLLPPLFLRSFYVLRKGKKWLNTCYNFFNCSRKIGGCIYSVENIIAYFSVHRKEKKCTEHRILVFRAWKSILMCGGEIKFQRLLWMICDKLWSFVFYCFS